jgi:syntaxin 5
MYASSPSAQAQLDQEQSQALLVAPSRGADVYLESRATAISNIDSTIQELGEMYQRLATIVSMQGEQIRRIDDNVVVTMGNVEGAHEQLVMYWDRMRSNRGLIIKVFLALIVFAIFFIGVIA